MMKRIRVELEIWYRLLNRVRLVDEKSGGFVKSRRKQNRVAIETNSIQTLQMIGAKAKKIRIVYRFG